MLMRVRVQVECAPHPAEQIAAALQAAGEELALGADSVSVTLDAAEPRSAVLEFEIRRTAQYKVVADIDSTVKRHTWAFYQEITIGFPRD